MNLQEEVQKENKKIQYNKEPVFYCKRCLSLKIVHVANLEDSDFCDECANTDIGQASIDDWEDMYIRKYKHRFLNGY